jgi:fumarylacetoacetate (FAA) hydrolase family protein
MSDLLEEVDPAASALQAKGDHIGSVEMLLQQTLNQNQNQNQNQAQAHFLAPCDLQVIKAAGVTFAASLVERVIEEQAKGSPLLAAQIRAQVMQILGGSLADIVPGSSKAQELKTLLIGQGLWSQYLEVGIGADAEVFTKAPILSAVGFGADVGIHPKSEWNNPEPEIVLAVDSCGRIKGATLGNDVNLRDFEGRSALLLGKAKDNNGSCAIGPFLRLFDGTYNLETVRSSVVKLEVYGGDGFVMRGESSMSKISRDPVELVWQTMGECHQYPDGFMLFLGTMFAPVQDRDSVGSGFTHHIGDSVRITTEKLGTLVNTVKHCDQIKPWTFGVRDLVRNLTKRNLLNKASGAQKI